MKIGIDARLWNESGVGRYISNLVGGIEHKNTSDEFVIFLNSENFKKINFSSNRIQKRLASVKWHTISEQFKFKKILDKENLDLVHFPYFSYPVFYKKPFVITIHDLIIDHYPTGIASSLPSSLYKLKHYAYQKVISKAVKNSKKIIVPSNATKVELISLYKANESKIEVIYEGFDPKIKKEVKSTKLISKNYILYVGNAYPHKNLERLFDAYTILCKKHNVDLVCIGRDDFFYKRLKNKKKDGIHIIHNVDDSKLFDYYTNARLFVMPSLMEGFGLPILEAMNLSCPVVCSNISALREIGGDACLYFDPKNTSEIADTLDEVLTNQKISKELIEKGRLRAKDFSWEQCVEKTLKVYESCNSV